MHSILFAGLVLCLAGQVISHDVVPYVPPQTTTSTYYFPAPTQSPTIYWCYFWRWYYCDKGVWRPYTPSTSCNYNNQQPPACHPPPYYQRPVYHPYRPPQYQVPPYQRPQHYGPQQSNSGLRNFFLALALSNLSGSGGGPFG